MKAINILLVLACTLLSFGSFCQSAKQLSKSMMLPNGWSLSPYGESLELGDLPLNMAVSPNQKYLIVTITRRVLLPIQFRRFFGVFSVSRH